jgi:cytochrome c
MKSLAAAAIIALLAGRAHADGRQLFQEQCASCHTLDGRSTAAGPSLKGVVWRKIASLKDFRYSAGLGAQVGDWSPDRLDAFLRNTQGFAPGTDMFWDIADPADRKAIVQFLERR